MATPVTNMRIPLETKEFLQKAAIEQGYESLTAFMITAGIALANSKIEVQQINYKEKLIEKYGLDQGGVYFAAYQHDTGKLSKMI